MPITALPISQYSTPASSPALRTPLPRNTLPIGHYPLPISIAITLLPYVDLALHASVQVSAAPLIKFRTQCFGCGSGCGCGCGLCRVLWFLFTPFTAHLEQQHLSKWQLLAPRRRRGALKIPTREMCRQTRDARAEQIKLKRVFTEHSLTHSVSHSVTQALIHSLTHSLCAEDHSLSY